MVDSGLATTLVKSRLTISVDDVGILLLRLPFGAGFGGIDVLLSLDELVCRFLSLRPCFAVPNEEILIWAFRRTSHVVVESIFGKFVWLYD